MFKKKKSKRPDEIAAFVYAVDTQEALEKLKQKYRLTLDSFGGFAACFPKKKFNIDEWQGKYVMYCETQEELFKFYDYLHSVGRKWSRGSSYKEFRPTETFDGKATRYIYFNNGLHSPTCGREYTVLNFKDFDWSDFDMKETKRFYIGDKVRPRGSTLECVVVGTYTPGGDDVPAKYTIENTKNGLRSTKFHYELELIERKSFTKEDLKPGMVVEFRKGDRRLYVNDVFTSLSGFMWIKQYNNDLTFSEDKSFDVVKVFKCDGTMFDNLFKNHNLTLIWERKEEEPVKEMTVAEIEEKLGFKVKVIADKED